MLLTIIISHFLKILAGYLIADFIMGVYHWFKDSYFTPNTPIIGKTFIWNSRLHHIRPRFVIEFSDWDLFSDSALWTLLWMGPIIYWGGLSALSFTLTLFFTIALNDVIHKYAHMFDTERPAWASTLQRIGLFQSHEEHHLHHIEPHTMNYCPVTPYTNGILEKLNFWRRLEQIVYYFSGKQARAYPDEFIEDPMYPGGIKFV